MMGYGAESLAANSEHAGDLSCMGMVGNHRVGNWERRSKSKSQTPSPEESVMGETGSDELVSYVNRGNSVLVSKSRSTGAAASELGFGNSVVVSNKSANNSSSSQSHVCRHCSKVFSSGRALGGHVRVHGPSGTANGQSSSSGNVSRADQVGDFSSTDIWVKKPKAPTSRSNGNSNWVLGDSIEEEEEEEEEEDEEQEDCKVVKTMDMDVEKEEELRNQKMVSLYTLRRNPKRSRRLTDEEFSMDLSAKNTGSSRNCVQCGKEFPSSKALFGHMRCHPERDWRGIQPPDDNSNASEDHYDEEENQNEISDGAIVLAPGTGLSPICWQSSQGSEDLEEKEEEETASDNESDRESMKMGKTTYEQQLASSSLPTWSVTAKRGRRRPIRSTQPQEEEAEEEEKEEEEEEGKDAKELEDDRDTAHFLVMLASAASNTNNIKVNGRVERQMTVESVYYSKKEKRESQVSSKDLEAGDEDLGWKDKKTSKKRRTDKTRRDESLSKELGAGQGNYKCSTCKKLFNSHQALGGHRASHRKVKGCFAINNINDEGEEVTEEEITEEGSTLFRIEYHHPAGTEDNMMHRSPAREEEKEKVHLSQLTIQQQIPEPVTPIRKKAKGHECSICHKVFPSGQALGGHKRCHWTGDRVTEAANSVISIEKQPPIEKRPPKLSRGQARKLKEPPLFDLNQPPPVEEDDLEAAYGMMEVVPACAQNLNEKVKMLEAVANAGFRYVQCNMCGCLCPSMEALRTHQMSHALMPPP